jgi:hypothetical protein
MTIVKLAIDSANKNRKGKTNDKIYTPLALVDRHIEHIKDLIEFGDVIYEPFAGDGRYVSSLREKFPNNQIEQTEIDNGDNFFNFYESVDIIISNPPYSCMDKVLEHSVKLNPRIISYLIGYLNFTPKRVGYMNANGYFIERILMCRVRAWFGISSIITFSNKINKNIIEVEINEYNIKKD